MNRINLMDEHAKELVNAPEGWLVSRWEAIGGSPAKLFRIDGAVAPPTMFGANKGKPNWRAIDKSTQRTAYFTPEDHAEWCRQWEMRTGDCSACVGTGEVFASWHRDHGPSFKVCETCGGTSKGTGKERP